MGSWVVARGVRARLDGAGGIGFDSRPSDGGGGLSSRTIGSSAVPSPAKGTAARARLRDGGLPGSDKREAADADANADEVRRVGWLSDVCSRAAAELALGFCCQAVKDRGEYP